MFESRLDFFFFFHSFLLSSTDLCAIRSLKFVLFLFSARYNTFHSIFCTRCRYRCRLLIPLFALFCIWLKIVRFASPKIFFCLFFSLVFSSLRNSNRIYQSSRSSYFQQKKKTRIKYNSNSNNNKNVFTFWYLLASRDCKIVEFVSELEATMQYKFY